MSTAFRQGIADAYAANLDWANAADADIKIIPMNDQYTVDRDAHQFMDNAAITANTYTGVTAENVPAAQRTVEQAAGGLVRLKVSGTITFASVAVDGVRTIPGFIVYRDTGNAATSPVLGYLERNGGALTPDGNNIDVTFDGTSGAIELTGNNT